ncbi:MAG: bifunctional [glutamine synthetase] adenylyltransferase/[glutamine synthetase]-adenylyl-L-tyrosine phosphorylase [Alphaproteobacteria bacterium]|nr:bifunctional [glutamine synthetase] adenylyltransferase/[glutamine synthetase]-adenylyl-L-tyrosine phosphorylase [Alphaproteobacteria bacterium]
MPIIDSALAGAAWPAPAQPDRAVRETERLAAAARDLEDRNAGGWLTDAITSARPLLDAVFGNSPFLSDCLSLDAGFGACLLRDGPDRALKAAMAEADQECLHPASGAALAGALRRLRRRVALTAAVADIGGLWDLGRVTGALSDLAEFALRRASAQALREAAAQGAITLRHPDDPERDSGLVVLAMGKLGARELNYSSDIDLIVLYDRERIVSEAPDRLQQVFVRIARRIVQLLDERTSDGYVARTDLRLRPDPGSTPLALTTAAAETYYETFGQNWERAAMIKARPAAGDLAAGDAFVACLRPYIWRKHLDFAAIQDIHSIKRQINAHRGGGTVAIAGHNVKIGRGGIREIEFYAQTNQLIWGGRIPALRKRATCEALAALAEAGKIDAKAAGDLTAAYAILRRVEHRLQMIDDQQTHSLPRDETGLAALATFLGHRTRRDFADQLMATLQTVERHYADLFEDAPTLGGPGSLVFTGTDDDPATIETLTRLGFREPQKLSSVVRGWHHGRYRAMRSSRARELLTELMPTLLGALARTPNPDNAFLRFDEFLGRLPSGVQLFSLFYSNPSLLDVVAEIMGASPMLAGQLSVRPQLLDFVLSPEFYRELPDRATLAAELADMLRQARDFQDALDYARRWKNDRVFQVGVQMLRGLVGAARAGAALANIAETAVAALQPAVEAEFARAHGVVPGGHLAVVAYGKLGSRELTLTSDLDLVFLYETPEGVETSNGTRPLPVSLYYIRLASRIINAVTAATGEGKLYELDTRLRPSGSKGPIAANIAGFAAYYESDAWTWEHMALTRARAITGPDALRARIDAAIRTLLCRRRDPATLAADVAGMRALIEREHRKAGAWDIKHRVGGLIDVEFIAQYVQLRDAAERPEILAANTAAALAAATAAGALPAEDGTALQRALALWQALQAALRLYADPAYDMQDAPHQVGAALARAAGVADFAALEALVPETGAKVRAIFQRLLPPEQAKVPDVPAS